MAPSTVGALNEMKNQPSCLDGRTAAGQEAASAQAVERGHQVVMVEVPDEEDDTAYQRWLTKGSPLVILTQPVVTLPTPPDSPDPNQTNVHQWPDLPGLADPKQGDLTNGSCALRGQCEGSRGPRQGWMKPLSVDWTLQNIQEVRSDNAARAQLVLWMHKDQLGELTDELLKELRIGGTTTVERLYEI